MSCDAVGLPSACALDSLSMLKETQTSRALPNKNVVLNMDETLLTDFFEANFTLFHHQATDPQIADHERHVVTRLQIPAFVGERHPVVAAILRCGHLA